MPCQAQVCVGALLVVCLLSVLRRQTDKEAGIQLNADVRQLLVEPDTRDV
jgi:hypothetical protein